MKNLKKFVKNLDGYFCAILLAIMLIVLFYQVIMRYIFKNSPAWSEELARYIFVWFIFIGASYAVKEQAHIKIDAALNLFPRKARRFVVVIGIVIWCVYCLIITYYSSIFTHDLFVAGQISTATKIKMWTIYLAVPVSHLLMTINLIYILINKRYINDTEGSY